MASSIALRRPRIPSLPAGLATQSCAGLAVAVLAAGLTWLIDEQGPLLGGCAVLGVLLTAWLATTRRTPLALALLMIYLGTLDGFLKLSTGVQAITFVRDGLLFAIVVGLLVRAQVRGTRLSAPPLTVWVGAFVVLVLVQLFNPQAGTLVHSLAGVRQHLAFVPLFFLTFAFVRTTKRLRAFVILLAAIAAANGAASWVQFNLKPDQLASWGPGYAQRVLGKGDFAYSGRTFADSAGKSRTRPFGLGSDAGSGGAIAALALGGILALASLARRLRYLLLVVVLAIGAIAAIVTSQGRGVVVAAAVIVLAYALLTLTSRGGARGLLALGAAGVLALVVVAPIVGSAGSSAFRYEGLGASEIVATTAAARPGNADAIITAITSFPLGAGLATAGPASGAPGGTDLVHTVNAESQYAFMTIETGVAGMLVIAGFTVWLFVLGVRRLRHEPDREARVLLAALIAPLAGMIALYYPSALTATTPNGPYLWAIAGIVSYWLVARPAQRRRAARDSRIAAA